jgi:hypothetical protein
MKVMIIWFFYSVLFLTCDENICCQAGGVTQVVKYLPTKHKALSSNANTAKIF